MPFECRILSLALKPERGQPMREVAAAQADVDGGLRGGARPSAQRGLTFLSARQWAAVQAGLQGDRPWHTRRANILLDADGLAHLIGHRVQAGQAVVDITGETRPCELMDEFQPGLKDALKPDMGGGVFGRVVESGAINVGDPLRVLGPIPSDAASVQRKGFAPA